MAKKKSAANPASSKPTGKQAEPKVELAKPHEVLLMPVAQNAVAMQTWGKFSGEADLGELLMGLKTQAESIQDGNMKPVEAMLYGQAMALQTIFTNLARRSAMNAGEYINAADTYMRLALKAQSQCRATLETLAEIKNPMPYIKQANIANGPQQVNNGGNEQRSAQARAHAGNSQTLQIELLEADHGQPSQGMDTRAAQAAERSHRAVETVESVHRAKKP